MPLHKIYQNGTTTFREGELYNPFPETKKFVFVVKLKTNRGGKREVDVPATSISDAENQIRELYKDCEIISTDTKK